MRGGAVYAALTVLFLIALAVQRCRSPFLAIEAERALAEEIAADSGMDVAEVMALRELLGVGLSGEVLRARAVEFQRARIRLGADELAVLVAVGEGDLADRLLREADGDAERATRALRPMPQHVRTARFRAMTERFSGRAAH